MSDFLPLLSNGIEVGRTFKTQRALFVLGNARLDRSGMQELFPEAQFCFLKQVHGRQVVRTISDTTPEADGHHTTQARLALVAITADCIPILLQNRNEIAALHAGWRGVSQNIVQACAEVLKQPAELAVLGPHIRAQSFEVERWVAEQLLEARPQGLDTSEFLRPHPRPEKIYFDLQALVCAQLRSIFPGIRIMDSGEDTFTDSRFHSFRRDKESGRRQYSFVMLNDSKPV